MCYQHLIDSINRILRASPKDAHINIILVSLRIQFEIRFLKDCMTRVGFWNDDAQVCREEVTKRWSRSNPGIHIKVVSIDDP